MKPENFIRLFAGTLVLVTSILGFFYSRNWLFVTMFVGLNLIQYSFTNFCPAVIVYKKLTKQ